jgi:hypothetical protein
MAKRVYVVKEGEVERLINAKSEEAATSYAIKGKVSTEVADKSTLIRLMSSGVKIEEVD